MTSYLPPDARCSAYWYALHAGMVTDASDPGDLEFLRELGLRAARLARWEGIPAVTAPEGPFTVYLWPERIWSEVADAMANHAAEHGDYGPEDARFSSSCDRCNYDLHRCKGCGEPLPHGREACAGCDPTSAYGHWGPRGYEDRPPGDSFWSYPAPPEDTQAYLDWCQMADAEAAREHDAGWPPMSSEDM